MRDLGGRRTRRTRRLGPALVAGSLLVGLLGLVGCSEEEPEDFTADTRSAFLAACTEPLADSRLISAICGCVFEESQGALSFDRFEAIDADLVLDPEADLPDEVAEIVARCVIEETEL